MKLSRKEFLTKCLDSDNKYYSDIYVGLEDRIGEIQHIDTEYDTYDLRLVRLNRNRRIFQIKYHREITGLGLKDSKDTIDAANNFLGLTIQKRFDKNKIISAIRNYLDYIQFDDTIESGLPFEIEINKIKGISTDHTIPSTKNDLIRLKDQLDRNGFMKVYYEEFLYEYSNESLRIEEFYIYFQPNEGVLVKFDTYWDRTSINSADMYYNWKPKNIEESHRYTSSGSFVNVDKTNIDLPPREELVWGGYHDIRTSFDYIFNDLRKNGTFVTPWLGMNLYPFLSTFGDKENGKKDIEYYKKTDERIKKMPYFVSEMTSYEKINAERIKVEEAWKSRK